MDVLHAWQQASAIVLSCPGPLRRHPKALLPIAELSLTQTFLGAESQLSAFAAAAPAKIRRKMVFAPLPEMFSGRAGLDAAFAALGRTRDDVVHLRFGSMRDLRVVKGVANAVVLAEQATAPPLTASGHPFASGQILPAGVQGVFVYGPDGARPLHPGGGAVPSLVLPPGCVTAGLNASKADPQGIDLVCLAAFDSETWAKGTPPPLQEPPRGGVLLPWNLAHFGSIVPELLYRLATIWRPGADYPPLLLMPFNDPGHSPLPGALIKRLRRELSQAHPLLDSVFFARITRPGGLAAIRRIASAAWVDGNDPEAWWSLARLTHAGFTPILLDPVCRQAPQRLAAEEPIWVESSTQYGRLAYAMRIPALRALPHLLAMSR